MAKKPLIIKEAPKPLSSLLARKPVDDLKKAKMTTFGKITERWGGFPPLRKEDGSINYETLIEVFWMLMQEETPDVTMEEVEAELTIDKMIEAMNLVTQKLRLSIPDALAQQIKEMADITQETEGKEDPEKKES